MEGKEMRIIKTKAYKYDELSEEAKGKAVIDMINDFYLQSSYEYLSPKMQKMADKMEKMRTPWFLAECLFFDCREEIERDIRGNEYEFTETGTFI